jgi:isoleucyl-tRNA synthetase
LVDQAGEKISKSAPLYENQPESATESDELFFDPTDFIEGSVKSKGDRRYGYGVDVMRAWAASKDTDKNIHVLRDQLEKVNKEVKMFREVVKILLMHSLPYKVEEVATQGTQVTSLVDRMMLVRLLEFSKEVTELYDKFDLAAVYRATQNFIVRDVTEFYLEFSRYRRRRIMHKAGDSPVEARDNSTLTAMYHCLQTILLTAAPILPFTA